MLGLCFFSSIFLLDSGGIVFWQPLTLLIGFLPLLCITKALLNYFIINHPHIPTSRLLGACVTQLSLFLKEINCPLVPFFVFLLDILLLKRFTGFITFFPRLVSFLGMLPFMKPLFLFIHSLSLTHLLVYFLLFSLMTLLLIQLLLSPLLSILHPKLPHVPVPASRKSSRVSHPPSYLQDYVLFFLSFLLHLFSFLCFFRWSATYLWASQLLSGNCISSVASAMR